MKNAALPFIYQGIGRLILFGRIHYEQKFSAASLLHFGALLQATRKQLFPSRIEHYSTLGIKKEAGISPRLSCHRNAYGKGGYKLPYITLIA